MLTTTSRQRLRSIDAQADVRITSVAARLRQEAGRPRMLAALTGMVGRWHLSERR